MNHIKWYNIKVFFSIFCLNSYLVVKCAYACYFFEQKETFSTLEQLSSVQIFLPFGLLFPLRKRGERLRYEVENYFLLLMINNHFAYMVLFPYRIFLLGFPAWVFLLPWNYWFLIWPSFLFGFILPRNKN